MNSKINIFEALNRTGDVTVKELREAGRFKNFTDQQLDLILSSIKTLTRIFFGLYRNKQSVQSGNI